MNLVRGSVTASEDTAFTLDPDGGGPDRVIPYDRVTEVRKKRKHPSPLPWIMVAAVATTAVVVVLIHTPTPAQHSR